MTDSKKIIMNFTVAPAVEDIEVLAEDALDLMPAQLGEYCDNIDIAVQDFPPEEMEDELGLESSFELLSYLQRYEEKIPGIQSKNELETPILFLYRRPLLDMWCETGEDIAQIVRQVMMTEIAQNYDFNEEEIEAMAASLVA
jgi:predicted Zn-dependent protease with MMP-like domain